MLSLEDSLIEKLHATSEVVNNHKSPEELDKTHKLPFEEKPNGKNDNNYIFS